MFICSVCLQNTSFCTIKTIGEQKVCSISCSGLLKSNSKDSCNFCHRPVWRDNYYKINNKYYCSEICKNKIIKKLNLPNDSKSIQHFHENIFNNNDVINLRNSKQLRQEVLKFYKDFHFDFDLDEEYSSNYISKSNNTLIDMNRNKNYKKIMFTEAPKERKMKNFNIDLNSININFYEKSKKDYYTKSEKPNNKNKNIFPKSVTAFNLSKNDINIIKNKFKNINKEQTLNKKKFYSTKYANYNYLNVNEQNEKNEHTFNSSNNNLNFNLGRNSHKNKFSFINTLDNKDTNINKYNTITYNNNRSDKKNATIIIDINKSSKSPVKININKNICKNCGEFLGSAKILDRNNNAFCSDYCKEVFLKYNYE